MRVEIFAGSKKMLELALGEGKIWRRMNSELRTKFEQRINDILAAESVNDLKIFSSVGYKYYDGFHQVSAGGDYRLWFTVTQAGDVILEDFDQGNH